jgi:hypothetical protein
MKHIMETIVSTGTVLASITQILNTCAQGTVIVSLQITVIVTLMDGKQMLMIAVYLNVMDFYQMNQVCVIVGLVIVLVPTIVLVMQDILN